MVESLEKGLPLHNGKNLASYFDVVRTRLEPIEQAFQKHLLNDDQLLQEISTVEEGLRKDLLSGELRLHNAGWPAK